MGQGIKHFLAGAFAITACHTIYEAGAEASKDIHQSVFILTGGTDFKITNPVGFGLAYGRMALAKTFSAVGVPQHPQYNKVLADTILYNTDTLSRLRPSAPARGPQSFRPRSWDI